MDVAGQEITKSGLKGGAGGLLGYIYYYFQEVIKWDIHAILDPGNLETLVTWAVAFFGLSGAIAGWNKSQPAPVNAGPPAVNVERVGPPPQTVDSEIVGGSAPYKWSRRSLKMLSGVHPDLQVLATNALRISPYDFGIAYPTGGKRTLAEQKRLIKLGASSLLNSRHLHGMAIDIVVYDENGKYTEDEWYYREVEKAFQEVSVAMGIPYRWGGDWADPVDTPHYELPSNLYPDEPDVVLA